MMCLITAGYVTNSVDTDQILCSAALVIWIFFIGPGLSVPIPNYGKYSRYICNKKFEKEMHS